MRLIRVLTLSIKIFLVFVSLIARSQDNGTIKATIIDVLSLQPVPYCTIALMSSNDKLLLKTTSNINGEFNFSNISKNVYSVAINSVGYIPKNVMVNLNDSLIPDTIRITPNSHILNEVRISGVKPLVTQQTDRFTYDVGSDMDSKVLSTLEMMQKVPLVSVDADGNIRIKGQSNLRILVDGKPSMLLDNKATNYLRNLPATNIARIEVITIPPSRYESEGLAGIIDIVMKRRIIDGHEVTLNAATNFLSDQIAHSADGAANLKARKFGVSASFGTAIDKPKQNIGIERYVANMANHQLEQIKIDQFRSPYTYGSAQVNFQADTLNLFTIQMNLYDAENTISGFNQAQIYDSNNNIKRYESTRASNNKYYIYSHSLNYERTFKRSKKEFFTLAYRYSRYPDKLFDQVAFYYQFNSNLNDIEQYNNQRAQEHTIQADYTFPLKKVMVEVGGKSIFRKNQSNYTDSAQPDQTSVKYDFNNSQDVSTIYNTYSFKLLGWSAKAGARLENTSIIAETGTNNDRLVLNSLNLAPSLAFKKSFSDGQSINLGYTQRISRPSIYALNTFIDRSNPYIQSSGNFSLQPSVGHNVQASYSKFSSNNFTAGLSYSTQTRSIQKISTYDETRGVSNISYENLGDNKDLGANLYYQHAFGKQLTVVFNSNINWVSIKGTVAGMKVSHVGLNSYISTTPTLSLNHGYRLFGSFSYEKRRITLQQTWNHNVSSHIGISKGFFNNTLNLSMFAYNPFQRYRTIIEDLNGNDFRQRSTTELYYRRFNARVSYKFGKVENQVRRVKKLIYNNDVE